MQTGLGILLGDYLNVVTHGSDETVQTIESVFDYILESTSPTVSILGQTVSLNFTNPEVVYNNATTFSFDGSVSNS